MIKKQFLVIFVLTGMIFQLSVRGSEQLKNRISDTVRINHAIQLANRLYEDFEYDSSLFYATQALELSNRLLHLEGIESNEQNFARIKALKVQSYVVYTRAIRDSDFQAAEDSLIAGLNLIGETGASSDKAALISGLGNIYDRKGQNDKALQYFKEALVLYKEAGDQVNYMYQLINLGLVLRVMGNYGESLETLMEALKTGRQVNDSAAIVESLLAMGFVYAFVEKWDDALRCQQEALAIYQQSNNLWGIARIHNDMGVTYNLAGELDSALIQHQAALEIRLKSNDAYNTFASYTYIGDILADKGNISKAIEYYENAIPYGIESGYKITLVEAYMRLGSYYFMLADEENSLVNFNFALQLSREIGDPTGQSRAAMGLTKIRLARNEYTDAIALLKIAEKTAPESNLQIRKGLYKEISETYSKLGDHKNAYLNSLIYSAVKDSVSAAENIEKITRLTNILAFENEMALQKESNEKMMAIKEAQINRERITRNIFLSGMLLAIVLVVITFIRFVEKKKLSRKLNETLSNLRATQTQLVHAEKMASLGELTAGIAHEIQNPLNFVNNFSEVSVDMIDELTDEMEKGNREEIITLKNDLKQNLRKINEHGKRADAIVKGMLQHSRTSTGQKEPVNLNALADEYLRLSYHGLRAKDKTFNADFKTNFDPNLPNVNVIPQDIGRVFLNLINNAFYSVAEKSKQNILGYKPEVIVTINRTSNTELRTSNTQPSPSGNLGVEICVKDNGIGIPDEIKDKIFQPFFTTKPTGQGTGLGLSLSYDIITKGHGGKLKVETRPGLGTEFIIELPT